MLKNTPLRGNVKKEVAKRKINGPVRKTTSPGKTKGGKKEFKAHSQGKAGKYQFSFFETRPPKGITFIWKR